MIKITLHVSHGAALWLKGYAAATNKSPSQLVADLLAEKRAQLAHQAYGHDTPGSIERFRSGDDTIDDITLERII